MAGRRLDAAPLAEADVADILAQKGTPYAAKRCAEKYHIATRRVYEIWRAGKAGSDRL